MIPPEDDPTALTRANGRGLFRSEVYARQGQRLAGDVILATPPGSPILCALVVIAVAAALTFASVASYARRETVSGWIVPDTGLIRLVARGGGVVESVSVGEGDQVRAGQAIAVLRLSPDLAGRNAFGELTGSLDAQREAARLRGRAAQATLEAEQGRLRDRLVALDRERAEVRQRTRSQEGRVALAREEVRRAEQIASEGFLPRRELDARRASALAEDSALSEMRSDLLALDEEVAAARSRLNAIPIDARAAAAEAASADAVLAGERTRTDSEGAYVVIATVDGTIAALPVRRGQTVASDATLAILMPASGSLGADLYIPSRAAGFVAPGQTVRLMYQAFPHQKFGAGEGRVASISRTVLAPREVDVPGLTFAEPVFRVRVDLERTRITAYGREMPLRPGMLLSADIVIDRRSLLEWVLDPLYAAGRR